MAIQSNDPIDNMASELERRFSETMDDLVVTAHRLRQEAWDEGWRAAWTPMAMAGLEDGPNPYYDPDEDGNEG